ncbi:hypothetical protein C2U70_24150 [Bradyrhizobium guangdongense]|uniref:hypothetical protein n=1 Tax=Bradyrhizobium guangdongense TaxID=1325090 RepID=UPI00112A3BAC|nr:hypothetical protein [Bradyrhizobium guangdongense]TPQ31397.1 hypothetical protein C2U70_24150 [Bradyrhizobium guangdongense]
MLEMVRQQMICIVVPGWEGTTELAENGPVFTGLEDLLRKVDVVQFASVALLPARADAEEETPSLMMELAIEEGIDPYDMLYRLICHPSEAMWALYRSYWPDGGPPLQSERNRQLLDKLMPCLSIADGGFIGARDRTARQIEKEQALLQWTRGQARALKATGQCGDDRAAFALALAQRAFQNPSFDWALEPAPRSYWRGKGASTSTKIGFVVGAFVLGLVAVWLVGAVPRGAVGLWTWLFGAPHPDVLVVVAFISKASRWVLGVSLRTALVVLVVLYFGWLFLVALPALFKSWRLWLESLWRELDRPTETWSSWSTYWVGWLVVVPLALAVVAFAMVFIFCPRIILDAYHAATKELYGWQIVALVLLALVALIVFVNVFSKVNQRVAKTGNWFFHPYEDDVPRAQQVHASIDRCEGQLVGGTAHMISLTDLRSPNGWSAWWIRTSLRIVTFAGRVFFTEGRLGTAPGIHFGHWHIIEGGRRYLFCSNYDGSFGGYLDDFINGATIGTTLAWRWTTLKPRGSAGAGPAVDKPRSFPPTRFGVFRGVKCELKFKSYARDSMLPHLYRFDKCKTPVDQIILATGLRDALFGERNDRNDDLIMRAIES